MLSVFACVVVLRCICFVKLSVFQNLPGYYFFVALSLNATHVVKLVKMLSSFACFVKLHCAEATVVLCWIIESPHASRFNAPITADRYE